MVQALELVAQYRTHNLNEYISLAQAFVGSLNCTQNPVIGLDAGMGVGKTTFIKAASIELAGKNRAYRTQAPAIKFSEKSHYPWTNIEVPDQDLQIRCLDHNLVEFQPEIMDDLPVRHSEGPDFIEWPEQKHKLTHLFYLHRNRDIASSVTHVQLLTTPNIAKSESSQAFLEKMSNLQYQ